ncbi:CDF family Co(II)/Ni(II) efflux transporter DmeF [Pseudomonas sp. CCI3.2]|uniref:CDF family Co(II)/Ni(II) efflux transporter DmeF n=1 Tax=unclassified Pseudomonas TaxID=196821 RepID=UPI002AC8B458|nr:MULTISPECIES: CDF family Co(II)/Ni(II) efflux transporter DmeF [unclassified Pseudomonas]MEB0078727.1 CDF family Co(II)/Ni(II) efflux transporter DmeF [Pseudomonas sp. MH10out]MEB0093537.1 CDF family Co(II)/Ni(II) efflux transporter DmeF [Pseudomonas sp. CCI4.2]MEB0100395.1 CDF family Co(II)/Ni(II) efflux transporter DmeF [Pseudomonas sp. CCI3.2]MEB0129581.1 CDF family Co(II)/Ni(II) efflux transporter DmeF [Pseudomonas sp. CCI2.4]MEB0159095.1 CDF family Co(II)/Ni(II) efflux transporter DmeF
MMSSQLNYTHDHVFLGAAHDENAQRTLWVVALTVVMMVGEITAGYLTGSMALLADGFHMATHAGALGIAAAAYSYAKRNAASARYSFGTGKVGDLGGFASALILGLVSIGIGFESVLRLFEPTHVQFGTATLIAIVGLAVNIVSALLLSGSHGHYHHEHGHDHGHETHGHGAHSQDNNLRSAYVHVLADALTSILAIAALLAGRYLGWVWLDPAMGVVGALVIARWAWTLMRDTAGVLLDKTDDPVAQEIREILGETDDATITDLHVWRVGPEARAAIVSVLGSPAINADIIRQRLAPVHEVTHLTVEYRTA